ncbi:hypothetical protein [Mesorhizobium sp. M0047]|uniref:hypothetical protein n=1 Tax=Mesorhizobium sp. M0047 TaxID=2956859 RepID=UPI00333B8142
MSTGSCIEADPNENRDARASAEKQVRSFQIISFAADDHDRLPTGGNWMEPPSLRFPTEFARFWPFDIGLALLVLFPAVYQFSTL